MKKLVLFLGLFLGFGAAFAQCPVKENPCKTPCVKEAPCHKNSITDCAKSAPCRACCEEYFREKYQHLTRELCLTREQQCKADELYNCLKTELKPIRDRAHACQERLCRMIENGDCNSDIRAQRRAYKETGKEFKETMKHFDKEFRCILDDCQLKKYKKIRRTEGKKMKKFAKHCPCYLWECSK